MPLRFQIRSLPRCPPAGVHVAQHGSDGLHLVNPMQHECLGIAGSIQTSSHNVNSAGYPLAKQHSQSYGALEKTQDCTLGY
jgi:hypothetical protein